MNSQEPVAHDAVLQSANSETAVQSSRNLAAVISFAPVIFLGAFLLFAVQPLIARFLLPWFGGTPAVWTTCLLFFQSLLLAGYGYAHLSVTYLPYRAQVILHMMLLLAAILIAPIVPSETWKPTPDQEPISRIILILTYTVGAPYVVLAGTSPLLQAWFLRATGGAGPYRLFALSNLGSLTALLSYPFLIEPNSSRHFQAHLWRAALCAFALLCAACGMVVWGSRRSEPNAQASFQEERSPAETETSWKDRALWLALPCTASVILLAVTNTLCQDIAAVPFLWVLPLSLYLITFIIAFNSSRWYPRKLIAIVLPASILWVLRLYWLGAEVIFAEQLLGHSVALTAACLFCHGELALLRPDPRRLTLYYLVIALGGALGGVLVAIVAPNIFNRFIEMPLSFLACAILSVICYRKTPVSVRSFWIMASPIAACLLVAASLFGEYADRTRTPVAQVRNFYGTLTVSDTLSDRGVFVRSLHHGRILHGTQWQHPQLRRRLTSYYTEGTGVALAMRNLPAGPHRIGIIGLGAGELAAYGRPQDYFRFYEINADVEPLARRYFTFLSDSPAKIDVVLGDGRLSLEREPPQQFDLLVLDAFAGDAVPAHLLTTEAFEIYRRHLKPGGILALHITNRYVDLYPVVMRQAQYFRLYAPAFLQNNIIWVLLTDNREFVLKPQISGVMRASEFDPAIKRWTDDHIDLLRVLRFISKK